jgi:hypothetical protein
MDVLCCILDTAPDAWDALEAEQEGITFDGFCSSLTVFLRSHLLLHWTNRVVLLAHNRSERLPAYLVMLQFVSHVENVDSGYIFPSFAGSTEPLTDAVSATLATLRGKCDCFAGKSMR